MYACRLVYATRNMFVAYIYIYLVEFNELNNEISPSCDYNNYSVYIRLKYKYHR